MNTGYGAVDHGSDSWGRHGSDEGAYYSDVGRGNAYSDVDPETQAALAAYLQRVSYLRGGERFENALCSAV